MNIRYGVTSIRQGILCGPGSFDGTIINSNDGVYLRMLQRRFWFSIILLIIISAL